MFNKYPFYKQLDSMDCGAVCLKMILKYYKKDIHIITLRELCNISRLGVNIGDIADALKIIGLNGIVFRTSVKYLQEKQPFPCILHWREAHFVVLYEFNKGTFTIGDPSHGIIKLPTNEFLKSWCNNNEKGIALLIEPTEVMQTMDLLNSPLDENIFQHFKNLLLPYIKPIAFLFLIILLSTSFSFIIPQTIQYMTDKGINHKDIHIIWQVLWFQFALFMGITIANYTQTLIQIKLSTRLSIDIISDFLYKLLNLPISFFDTKNHADIYQRIEDHSRIESFLSTKIVSFVFSILLVLAYSVQLFLFDAQIMGSFILFTVLSFIWFFLFQEKRKNLDYRRFGLAMEERSTLGDLVAGMTEIKLNNAQRDRVAQWKRLQDKLYMLKMSSLRLFQLQRIGISGINQVKSFCITFLCAYWVIEERISFGVMLSVGYIIGQLNVPMEDIMTYFHTFQDASISFERLNEIHLRSDENNDLKTHFPAIMQKGFLLKNVSFKYPGSHNSLVIKNLNLVIPKGKITAIVGTSGSGKTTLLKILLAFYHPEQGNIFLDDINIKDINTDELRNNCGVVMQDGYIYNASIAENIALAHNSINIEQINNALKIACLYDFVQSLPLKHNTKIGNVGVDLSGGQKQRLFIARAVYKNPQIVFLDEATSSLDSNNEKEIMNNLAFFLKNKTVIVIAHRLSTVKNADQIVVLNNGQMVEMGSHEQLINNKSNYYELIKNQLELGT